MPIRVSEIRSGLTVDEAELAERALRLAGVSRDEVANFELVRQSLDRRRRQAELVSTVDLHLKAPERPLPTRFRDTRVRSVTDESVPPVEPGDEALEHPPVVIGAGPGGLFAALVLARAGFRPVVFERGARMNERVRHIESFHRRRTVHPEANYLFGEGGAGTFSDGKLTSRSKDPRARSVLDEFRIKSGMASVGYFYRPHLGSDRVRAVVGQLRREIEALGGTLRYGVRVDRIRHGGGRVERLQTSDGDVPARIVIAAAGHSARDFFASLLADGFVLEPKPFQFGFRVEHTQEFVNIAQYGGQSVSDRLGPADYRLVAAVAGDNVFSFCMCPGGQIMAAVHDDRHFSTNGMSYFRKDTGFANSGLVTTIEPGQFGGDDPLAGVRLQEHFERVAMAAAGPNFELPAQRLADFVAGRPSSDVPPTSCRSGQRPHDVSKFAPEWVADRVRRALAVFDRQMPGYVSSQAVICGPEARSSSPVRIVRDSETLCGVGVDGFYPCGEGAGYAGGIVSAAIDGWRAAEAVIKRFSPAKRLV